MKTDRLLKAIKIVLLIATAIAALGFITQLLWNWLMPEIFGLTHLSFTQAVGLVVLSKILFGGLHRHGAGRGWKHRMGDRLATMTPEERERFRSGMSNRRGWCRPTPAQPTSQPTL